jgi:nucleoside-diphosphate-sugar epimerase
MRIAVTGSSGKLGIAVVRELLGAGYDVLPLDIKAAENPQGPPTHVVDLTKPEQVIDALKNVDGICHLGNFPGFGDARGGVGFANNVASTFNVFHAAVQLRIARIVNASSIQAYGIVRNNAEEKLIAPRYLPIDEDHALLACNPYGLSKAMGESIAEAHVRRCPELSAFSLRFTYIAAGIPAHVALNSALKTFVAVSDAARAVRLCIETDRGGGHTPLNIAAPVSHSPWTESELISAYGQIPPFKHPLQKDQPLLCCKKAERLLGFIAAAPVSTSAPGPAPAPALDFQKP